MLSAIEDEIVAVERDVAGSIEVAEAKRLHVGPGGALYTARAELTVPLAPETPIVLLTATNRSRGKLVAVEDFDVLVHLDNDVGLSLKQARITTEPAFILEALRDRLARLAQPNDRALPTVGSAGALTGAEPVTSGSDQATADRTAADLEQIDDPALHPNAAQLRAMSRVAGSNLHFVWGPPGTGKTAALAQIARMLADLGDRVLVLAHANVAVDVAMLRIADAFSRTAELADGRILRLGQPHHQEALTREEILVDSVLARKSPELALERAQLERRRREIAARLRASNDEVERDQLVAELRRVRERLTNVRDLLKEQMALLVRDATVVGATLSRFVLSDYAWEWGADAILLDEASMVSFPWVLAAATHARKRLIILGDFRQLPPVYQARTEAAARWLARDAFEVAGVRGRVDAGTPDDRVTLLDTQYRMARPIAEAVSKLAYGGALRTDDAAADRAARLAHAPPWPGDALVVVDTSGLSPAGDVEAKPGSFSRVNPLHALLALSLAAVATDRQAALISPYRAQARLLAAGVSALALNAEAATIHRFQGSERELVIFDLVDAPPLDEPSRLTGSDVGLALRLTNVGISRAQAKAVLLAQRELVLDRFAPNSPVRRALELCEDRGKLVTPQLADTKSLSSPQIEWMSGEDMLLRVHEDLRAAKSSLVGNVPPSFQLDEEVLSAIGELARGGGHVVVWATPNVVARLERYKVELRLMVRPWLLLSIDRTLAYVSGMAPHLGARVSSPILVGMLETLLFGDIERGRLALGRSRTEAREELPPAIPQLPAP